MPTRRSSSDNDERQSRWTAPFAACVVALAVLPVLGESRTLWVLVGRVAVAAITVIGARAHRGSVRPKLNELRSPWVLAALAVGALAYGSEFTTGVGGYSGMVLLAGAALALAMGFFAWDRLRQLAIELIIEAIIGTGGLAVLSYGLLLDPWLVDGRDNASAVYAFGSLALVAVAFFIYLWLMMVDHEAKEPASSLLMATGALIALADALVLHDVFNKPWPASLRVVFPVVGTCVVAASIAHPSQRLLRTPAMNVQASKIEHRALMAITSVMVGPSLILLDITTSFTVSLTFAALGSAILSVVVSAHVFRLLRKWGALEHDVHHDSLTGLPNRTFFNSRLELGIELARGERRTLAVMFIDLDRFKNVNDSLGHAAGNSLLIQVARRLRVAVDKSVTVARLAGDEFAILIPAVRNYKHTESIGKALLKAFEEPFEIGRRKLYVTPSIGVAHYPTDGLVPSELLEHADAAMYRAKERGRNTVELYTAERRAQAVNRLDLESALHNAVDENQLELFYQPKVNISTGRVVGVEALLRWDHPILGPIPPDEFIPLAEESGLISIIGEWTLIEGCTQARAWMDKGIEGVSVAVNLSPRQFQLQRVQDMVARVLRFTRLPAELLELELTENLALQDPIGVGEVIADLHAMGVKISIDDFGVGYSGLGYLDQFSFDCIKIDRKFVNGIDEHGAPIVTAVIAMAKGLQIDVVAEGVENMAQLEFLRRHGCDMMQGYLFSRPLRASDLEPILQKVLETPLAALVRSVGQQ